MQSGAEPLSLSIRLGQVVVISAPQDQAPHRLDWGRWVVNTALRYEQFESPSPRRVFLLDRNETLSDGVSTGGLQYARQNMQTANLLGLLAGWSDSTLTLLCGTWEFTLSSWIESVRQISLSAHGPMISSLLQTQLDRWREWINQHRDDSLFVLSDSGVRFQNAGEHCEAWLRRVIRSRLVPETRSGAWAAGVMTVYAEGDGLGRAIRLHRLMAFNAADWCGNPTWELDFIESIGTQWNGIDQIWISLPSAGMVADVWSRLMRIGVDEKTTMYAPSVFLGWHPLRDLFAFINSKTRKRLFVYMDHHERLQFLLAEDIPEGNP